MKMITLFRNTFHLVFFSFLTTACNNNVELFETPQLNIDKEKKFVMTGTAVSSSQTMKESTNFELSIHTAAVTNLNYDIPGNQGRIYVKIDNQIQFDNSLAYEIGRTDIPNFDTKTHHFSVTYVLPDTKSELNKAEFIVYNDQNGIDNIIYSEISEGYTTDSVKFYEFEFDVTNLQPDEFYENTGWLYLELELI